MFFFSSRRRHTRLQGDWSSDVCSSDLYRPDSNWEKGDIRGRMPRPYVAQLALLGARVAELAGEASVTAAQLARSGERRVGEEWRSRGSAYHLKKKKKSSALV